VVAGQVGPDAAVIIPVYYDFASTLCYVAHRVMGRLAPELERLGVVLDWQPIDLTGITGWRRGATVQDARRANALRVAADLNVPVRMPRYWQDSRAAHAVVLGLDSPAKRSAWRERVWTAVYEEGRPLGDAEDLIRLGRDLDVAVEPLVGRPQLSDLETRTRAAQAAGVAGVPTFMLGTFAMAGIQEPDTMTTTFARFVHRRRGVDEG